MRDCLVIHLYIFFSEHTFRSYLPSLVAASCIAASRISLQLTPTWPKGLELMSGYCIEELLPCVHLMLRYLYMYVNTEYNTSIVLITVNSLDI